MGKQFPHINENMNDFPKNNERVYEQYDNNFDYSNYIGHYTIFKHAMFDGLQPILIAYGGIATLNEMHGSTISKHHSILRTFVVE